MESLQSRYENLHDCGEIRVRIKGAVKYGSIVLAQIYQCALYLPAYAEFGALGVPGRYGMSGAGVQKGGKSLGL